MSPKPITFYPNKKYQTNLFINIFLLITLAVTSWSVPTGFAIGYDAGTGLLWALVALLFSGLLMGICFALVPLYFRSLRYEIHDDEVIVFAGIITKSVKHVPFRTVTNIQIVRGPIERMLGLGSLNIQTAGMSGTTGAEEKLVGLPNVDEIYELVATELRRFRGAMSPTQTDDVSNHPLEGVDHQDRDILLAILEEIRGLRADQTM